ncbi:MAG: acyltransferase [Muribaculaceae bacterium]|nr:acyltransferase [Muribaculaceae bacterium]
MTTETSRVISWLRFPIVLPVVFFHNSVDFGSQTLDYSWFYGFLYAICNIGVIEPLFFISGYLFFAKRIPATPREWLGTWRHKTLPIVWAFLLWTFLCWILAVNFAQHPVGSYIYEAFGLRDMPDYWPASGHKRFMSQVHGMAHLWYLHDLVAMMLIAPVLLWMCRHLPKITLILITAWYFLFIGIPLPGFGNAAIFFFTLGVWCAVNNTDPLTEIRKGGYWLVALAILGLIAYTYTRHTSANYELFSYPKTRLIALLAPFWAIILEFRLAARLSRPKKDKEGNYKNSLIMKLGESSFLVYLGCLLLADVIAVIFFGTDNSEVRQPLQSVIAVTAPILLVALYFLAKRYCPALIMLLTGRKPRQSYKNFA